MTSNRLHPNLFEAVRNVLPKYTPNANSVHELAQKLEAAFTPDDRIGDVANRDSAAVVNRFLKLTGWTQGARRVFESMPHADSVENIAAFRSMLFRLGYKTTVEDASADNLRDEYLPCFVRTKTGKLLLIEKAVDRETVLAFDPKTGDCLDTRIDDIAGAAIFPELHKAPSAAEGAPPPKWSSTAITAFKPVILQIFLISFLINIFALAPPLYVMNVYDKAIGSKSLDVLIGLSIGIMLVVAADYALRQIRVGLQAYLGARLDEQLNETAFRHLQHLALSYTDEAPVGSQLTRLRQMTSLHEAFTGPLAGAVFDLPFVILFITVIAIIGGHLVWVPLALIAAYLVVSAWAVPKTGRLIRKAGDAKAQLNNLTVEAVSNQRAIKDLGAEHVWLGRQRRLSADSSVASMNARQLNFLIQTFSQSMVAVAGVAILAIGASLVVAGDLSAGALIAVMALSWRVLGPIRNIFLSGLTLSQTLQSVEQIDRLVRIPLEREPNTGPSIPRRFKGHVVFDRVTFKYAGQKEPALRSISFEVKPGELLCLYGHGGSGTSTALRVLLGLYQQQAGSVFIDGLDLRQLDKGEWRHSLGVGLNSLDLFHGTIAQNIRLAHPAASDDEVADIVRRFKIDRYFGSTLTEGLETKCSTSARSTWPDALVSRIMLCRAFIKQTPIYLLDEPAALLDDEGEQALLTLIAERRKTSSIIMTTQRPSHMRLADRVVWMERGAVREMGPPEDVVPKLLAA